MSAANQDDSRRDQLQRLVDLLEVMAEVLKTEEPDAAFNMIERFEAEASNLIHATGLWRGRFSALGMLIAGLPHERFIAFRREHVRHAPCGEIDTVRHVVVSPKGFSCSGSWPWMYGATALDDAEARGCLDRKLREIDEDIRRLPRRSVPAGYTPSPAEQAARDRIARTLRSRKHKSYGGRIVWRLPVIQPDPGPFATKGAEESADSIEATGGMQIDSQGLGDGPQHIATPKKPAVSNGEQFSIPGRFASRPTDEYRAKVLQAVTDWRDVAKPELIMLAGGDRPRQDETSTSMNGRSPAMSKSRLAKRIANHERARPRQIDWPRHDLQQEPSRQRKWTVSLDQMDAAMRERVSAPLNGPDVSKSY